MFMFLHSSGNQVSRTSASAVVRCASSSKSPSRSGKLGSDFASQRAVVPPVLREVGKLAAGVASVSTNSGGSATDKTMAFLRNAPIKPARTCNDVSRALGLLSNGLIMGLWGDAEGPVNGERSRGRGRLFLF
ncbi:hypothetical protein Zmor_022783 [Zophobas morio]|uniref:Uncharacterized protein n=1 Tax=Zophobas morio TaxID=2755281 RepID=A0AA38M6E2_9CUCU|nr:hypothetical protein Zmor_022116 [Zophobas morio]KAJ3645096.1 hypothetical protein Zmor_022783 [Zophobas morio]